MALIFSDAFTEASNTDIVSHTPTTLGTGWTREKASATAVAQARAADYLEANLQDTSNGMTYSAQPDPTNSDIQGQFTFTLLLTGSNSAPIALFARFADTSNYYTVQILGAAHAQNDTKIYKRVAGAWTQLAAVDTGWSIADVLKFEVIGTSLKVYKNGAEILAATDSAISAAGKTGFAWGQEAGGNGSHVFTDWQLDDYTVTEVDATVVQIVSTVVDVETVNANFTINTPNRVWLVSTAVDIETVNANFTIQGEEAVSYQFNPTSSHISSSPNEGRTHSSSTDIRIHSNPAEERTHTSTLDVRQHNSVDEARSHSSTEE